MLLVLVRLGLPLVFPNAGIFAVLGAVVAGLVIFVWWVFFSRAPWPERLGVVVLMIAGLFASRYIVHASIRGGMMGMMLPIYLGIPGLSLALVAWAVASRGLAPGRRRAALVATILLACGAFTLLRTDGITGQGTSQLTWRWTPTAEERLLAQSRVEPFDSAQGKPVDSAQGQPPAPPSAPAASAVSEQRPPARNADVPATSPSAPAVTRTPDKPLAAPAVPAAETYKPTPAATAAPVLWPGFRGPGRDGVIRGVRIGTDWSTSPPVQLWRRPIGPGWSSFAVRGDLLYTQEQRGDKEVVSSYKVSTGGPVWRHRDAVRFYESNGGAGPRGTPTISNGRVYTLGATGVVNALNADNGAVVWSRNASTDTGATLPGWGFASSPLVVDDVVIVAASGRLVGYDVATGKPRWVRPTRGGGYSSPHLVKIEGVAQILLLSGGGVTSVAPADGSLLWEHSWLEGVSIVQPAMATDGEVLITAGDAMGGSGMRRIAVAHKADGWTAEERWTSRGLKPYYNDFVVHEGHAFGFDGSILSCISLEDGARKWKGGRYGSGQLVLLPDQDLLLVLSEEGELALVSATPDKFTEVARFKAIEGKTWNHPALVGDVLLVRNGEEMAAFRLPLVGR